MEQPDAPYEGLPVSRRRSAAASVWLALVVCILDSSIANVALPTIAHDLGVPPGDIIAIVIAFQLGVVVALLPMAALGEIVTYRSVFLGGLILFTIASLGCALSRNLTGLVLSRFVQGIGTAGVVSVNGALARYMYPPRLLGAALGANALVIAAFGALGPTIASAILTAGPWQWLFAINLPIGAAALALGLRTLPGSPRARHGLDVTSTVLNIIAFTMLVGGVEVFTPQPTRLEGWALLGGGALVALLLVKRCLSQPQPLVPIDLLRVRLTRLSALTSMLAFAAQTLTQIALPFYLQGGLKFSLLNTGLLMALWPFGIVLAAPVSGRLADRVPAEFLILGGLLVMTLALVLLAWLAPNSGLLPIALLLGLCGLGFGFFQAPNNRALLSSAPMNRSGAAAGLVALSRTTGQIAGAMLVAGAFRFLDDVGPSAIALAAGIAAIAGAVGYARALSRKTTSN